MNEGIPKDWSVYSFRDITERIQDGTHFSPKSQFGNYLYITSKNIKRGSWTSVMFSTFPETTTIRYTDVAMSNAETSF